MTKAPGTKKKMAARAQRLMEEVPLCPAAAIQRGPRTVAMLKSRTSQKPMDSRSWDLGSRAGRVMRSGFASALQASPDDSLRAAYFCNLLHSEARNFSWQGTGRLRSC